MSVVEKTKENLGMCKCMGCPSYTISCKIKEMPHNLLEEIKGIENSDHLEQMFCAYTTSDCITKNAGCLCDECNVHEKYHLEEGSYCIQEGRN